MDSVFDAQFRNIRDAFLTRGHDVRVAYRPDGQVDYVYLAGRILTRAVDQRASEGNLTDILPGIRPVRWEEELPEGTAFQAEGVLGGLRMWSIEGLRNGRMTVPEALELVDRRLPRAEYGEAGGEQAGAERADRPRPVATPVHVLHVTDYRACPAVEPSVPSGPAPEPWPPLRRAVPLARPVTVAVSDTGLLRDADQHPWLAGVTAASAQDFDELGPRLPTGRSLIQEYSGHGTFIAGVIRSLAPGVDVRVANHFPASGAWLEHEIVLSLENLIAGFNPDVISLSAGSYTRDDWEPLTFSLLHELNPHLMLVAAAGNEATDQPFYPAAFDWVVGVGALGADQAHRAWFSNYGDWVDVYALGEGLVNAYATGTYEYQEPPRRPAKQDFDGMARWDGTSFATPVVAGLIAAELAGDAALTPQSAWAAVLGRATTAIDGARPAIVV